jgi:hypothetical protein
MSNTDLSLLELKRTKADVLSRIQQLDAEMTQLGQTDPIAAEKLKEQAIPLFSGLDEIDSLSKSLTDKLTSKIADGSFLTEDLETVEGSVPTTPEAISQKLKSGISTLLDADVDLESGLDSDTRFGLAFKTDDNKAKYLADKFGPENIKTLNVLGSPMQLVKDESGKWKATDEFGLSLKDAIDVSGEIFPMISSGVGGAGGLALSKTPSGATVGSAAGYTFGAALQDQIATAFTGTGPSFLEAIPERATQGAAGMPFEYIPMKLLSPIGMGVARSKKGFLSERQALLEKDEAYLKSRGYDISLANIAKGSDEKTLKRLQLASKLPNYQIGKDVLYGAKRLEAIKNSALSTAQKSGVMYDDTLKALAHEKEMLEGTLALYDKDLARSVALQYDDEIYKFMSRPRQDKTSAGEFIFNEIKAGRSAANKIKDEVYTPFYQKTRDMGLSVDPIEVAKAIEGQYYQDIVRSPQLKAEIDRLYQRPKNLKKIEKIDKKLENSNLSEDARQNLLRQRQSLESLSGDLDAKQLDTVVKIFREAVPEGGTVGGTTKEIAAGRASKTVSQLRDQLYADNGLLDEWNYATNVLQQRLGYNEQQLGSILRETLGRSDMTGSQINETILSDPRIVGDVLNAVSLAGPEKAFQVAGKLQQAYLEKIGVASRRKGFVDKFDFDPEIVTRIFGIGENGKVNPIYGQNMVKKLENLQDAISKAKIDPSKIDISDLQELQGTLSEDSVKKITNIIIEKGKTTKKLDEFKNNALLNGAMNGHREAIERGEFPAAMWAAKPDMVRKALSKFGSKDQEMLRGDFIEHFFGRYPADQSAKFGDANLWDANQFLKDASKNPSIIANMRAVAGDEFTDDILAASRMMDLVKKPTVPFEGKVAGAVINEGGVKGYINPMTYIRPFKDRFAAAAYRVQNGKPFKKYLKDIGRKELTPEQMEQYTQGIVNGVLATSQGIQALTQTGKYDPEWSADLGKLFGTIPKETLEYREQFGVERPFRER